MMCRLKKSVRKAKTNPMTLKEKFADFNRIAPVQTADVPGKPFAYRYYQNPDEKKNVHEI